MRLQDSEISYISGKNLMNQLDFWYDGKNSRNRMVGKYLRGCGQKSSKEIRF